MSLSNLGKVAKFFESGDLKNIEGLEATTIASIAKAFGIFDRDTIEQLLADIDADPKKIESIINAMFNSAEVNNGGLINKLKLAFTGINAVIDAWLTKLKGSAAKFGSLIAGFFNPTTIAITAAAAVTIGAFAATIHANLFDTLNEKAQESLTTYESTVSELQSLQDQLKINNEKLIELDAIKAPTLAEKDEIYKLQIANNLLDVQIKQKEELAKLQQEQSRNDAYKALSNDFFGDNVIEKTKKSQEELTKLKEKYAKDLAYHTDVYQKSGWKDTDAFEELEKTKEKIDALELDLASDKLTIATLYSQILGDDGNIKPEHQAIADMIIDLIPELDSGYSELGERLQAIKDSFYNSLTDKGTNGNLKTILSNEFSEWVDSLSEEDQQLVYEVYCSTDTAEWTLEDWKKAIVKSTSEAKASFKDFAAYQETVNGALESSKSTTGLSIDEIENLTNAYKDLDGFDASKLFEETAHGIHLNTEELSLLNEEMESDELKKYADEIRRIQEEIYRTRLKGEDTSSLESELEEVTRLKSQYEALTSSYNKWLAAKSAPNERDSYENIGSGYDEMKEILDQGWYGDESLNEYLDLILSADQRTGDAIQDFAKLKQTISGTNHSIMDYWKYDSDDNLLTDGLFTFLDDVNKKLGDSYATINDQGEYSFDFAGDKLREVADAFGVSTEMIELFVRAMIDAGMAVDMGDLTLAEQIDESINKLKEFKELGKVSDSLDLDFDIDSDPLEDVKTSIDDLKSERLNIDAEADPELASLLDDLIAKCEQQYYFRLNAETNGSLDQAIFIVRQLRNLTARSLSVDVKAANQEEIIELANTLATLPPEVQTAVGIKEENIGNVDGIINQINTLPESLTVPVNYTVGEQPETVDDATGVVNYEVGDSPTTVPPARGVANYTLGDYPKYLPPIYQHIYSQYNGTAKANGTAINAHANGHDWALPRDENALVNEVGTESIVRNGKWNLIPGGAHIEKLKRGDIIFSAKQTDELLKTGKVTSGGGHGKVAFSDGTINAYDTGTGGTPRPSYTQNIPGSATGSTNSTKASADLEVFDWIKIAIARIQEAIERVAASASSAYKALKTKLGATYDQISLVNKELEIQEKAYARYMKEANSVGLSSNLVSLIQTGAIDISRYDEKTRELIADYQEWYDKATECSDAIADLRENLAELYVDKFDNIQNDLDNQLSLLDHLTNSYNSEIDRLGESGYLESTKFYIALQNVEQQRINVLTKELESLELAFSEAMNSGEIEEYSDAWYDMQTSINDVKEQIDDASISMIEFGNTVRELEWEYFDFARERVSKLIEESEFLIDLLGEEDLFNEQGQMNDSGLAAIGLRAMNYNTYMAQADKYVEEILKLNEEIAKDPYNTKLIDRREELLQLQRESITAAEDEKEAIADLVEEGINIELEALQELIDKYGDALDNAKDFYDYQKKIRDHTSEISSLEKQLLAYQGNTSEEAKSVIQKIQVEFEKAREDLEEAEYDQYISDQKKLLDELYIEYEAILNQRLDNVDVLIEEMIGTVNANSDLINSTIVSAADNVGYTLTDKMQEIWDNDIDTTLTIYGDGFNEKLTSINQVLSSIQANTIDMIAKIDEGIKQAEIKPNVSVDVGVYPTTPPTPSTPKTPQAPTTNNTTGGGSGSSSAGGSSSGHTGNVGYNGNKTSTNYPTNLSGDRSYTSAPAPYLSPANKALEEFVENHQGYLSSIASKSKKYKSGGLADYTGLAWLDGSSSKPELVLNPQDTENFIELKDVLYDLARRDISLSSNYGFESVSHLDAITDISGIVSAIRSQQRVDISPSVTYGDINIEIEHVEDYNDFVNQLVQDSKFEKAIKAMTTDRLAGGSRFAKNKFTW